MKPNAAKDRARRSAAAQERSEALRARIRDRAPIDRDALSARIARQREAIAARQAAAKAPPKRDNRRWLVVVLLVLLVLLLGRECACTPDALPPPATAELPSAPSHGAIRNPAAPPPPTPKGVGRPAFTAPAAVPITWTTLLHQQVAARGPAVAACVQGSGAPSAVRWSFLLEPHEGRVSAATLEPLAGELALSSSQEACVLGVLASPPYRLGDEAGGTVPRRVTLVVEL